MNSVFLAKKGVQLEFRLKLAEFVQNGYEIVLGNMYTFRRGSLIFLPKYNIKKKKLHEGLEILHKYETEGFIFGAGGTTHRSADK